MSKFNPHDYVHVLARHLNLTPRVARALLRDGKLPGPETRDLSVRLSFDRPWLRAVEAARPQFDTSVTAFIDELRRYVIPRLFSGVDEDLPPNRRLVEFRFHAFGECNECTYPIDRNVRPWHGHRVGVSRAQLVSAGYVEFHSLWSKWSGPDQFCKTAEQHAFSNVKAGGEVQLGPFHGYWSNSRPELRTPRAEFLGRLCDVLDRERDWYQ